VSQRDGTTNEDRLIFLAEALALVPFSETTLRRAIAKGELEAWRVNRNGKLVIWRNAVIAWATRQPASNAAERGERSERSERSERRTSRPVSRRLRRRAKASQAPDPIEISNLG
jgi:hypothetical protein